MNQYVRILTAVAMTVMMAPSTTAWAGALGGTGVTITFSGSSGTASGAMGNVRNSTDTVQYIGCTVFVSGIDGWVSCSARDANNITVTCSSAAPAIVQVAHAMTSDARLTFNWDASGACTDLRIHTDSRYAPKNP